MTVIPLFLYVRGVELAGLGPAGMIFYITPTLQFILGFFIYNEQFNINQLVSFILINFNVYANDTEFNEWKKNFKLIALEKGVSLKTIESTIDKSIFGTGKFFKEQSLSDKHNIYDDIEDAINKSPENEE